MGGLGSLAKSVGVGGTLMDINKKYHSNQWADPADLWGHQEAAQREAVEREIAEGQSDMARMLASQPKYKGLTDAQGNLQKKYSLSWGKDIATPKSILGQYDQRLNMARAVNPGQSYGTALSNLDALQGRAFGTETSPWAQKLYDQQALEQQGMSDQLSRNLNLGNQQAMSNMAATGGLDSGARERMMRKSAENEMFARQDLARQGAMDRLGIGIQDESQRMALQQQLPGMMLQADQYNTGLQQDNNQLALNKANLWGGMANTETDRNLDLAKWNKQGQLGIDQANVANLIGDRMGQNQFAQDAWGTAMNAWGAGRTADAQARQSVKKGGLLGGLFG